MTVEYRIPADHPTCPRHPDQPRDFCTPCADHYRHVMAAPVTCPACKGKPVDGDCATCEGLGAVASPARARLASPIAAARTLLNRLMAALTARRDARWLDAPAGCCSCGTGGPYYAGKAERVTRYVYDGRVMAGSTEADADSPGWSSCSRHPLTCATPVIDYGQDVKVTFRQQQADFALILAGQPLKTTWATHTPAGFRRTWTSPEMHAHLQDIARTARDGADEIDGRP